METTKIRGRMAVSERAKQFMPFKAVSGLDEALERKRLELGIIEEDHLINSAKSPTVSQQ